MQEEKIKRELDSLEEKSPSPLFAMYNNNATFAFSEKVK